MRNRELLMMASVLALLRGEVTVRGVAERFGVTEAQVARWKDVFEIAGTLALSDLLSSTQPAAKKARKPKQAARREEPTTFDFGEPTTFET